MPVDVPVPVLVGNVPLFYVQNLSVSEGYRIERIAGSRFSQAIAPTTKTIEIQAMLIGRERLILKKQLEALALVSRVLVAATAPALAIAGIPVVSGLTISTDMQITTLNFSQNAQNRDALDVRISLVHMPRSSATLVAGELAELSLAAGTAMIPNAPAPHPIPRLPGS